MSIRTALSNLLGEVWPLVRSFLAVFLPTLIGTGGLVWMLVQRLLDHRLAKNLDAFRMQQQKAMAEFQSQLETRWAQIERLRQKEFELATDLWKRLVNAQRKVLATVFPYREAKDVAFLPEGQWSRFLQDKPYPEYVKDELLPLTGQNRQERYTAVVGQHLVAEAWKAIGHLRTLAQEGRVFLDRRLYEAVCAFDATLTEALAEYERQMDRRRHPSLSEAHESFHHMQFYLDLRQATEDRLGEIESLLHVHLSGHQADVEHP